jgi:hypothetical protein
MGCQCNKKQNEGEENNELEKGSSNGENGGNQISNNYPQKEGLYGQENPGEKEATQKGDINNGNYENNRGENEQEQENNYDEMIAEEKNAKYKNYPERMLELINMIREDPVSYANTVEDSIQNIIEEENVNDENKPKIIYKKKVKVSLTRGEPAFREVAEILRNMEPLPPLEFNNDICVPLPENEEELKDSSYLKEHIKFLRETTDIDVFYKDLIKVPEVSALLMVVDDSPKNSGRKRQALLNPEYKYIGINSKFVGKTFIAYFTFSK